MSFKLDNSLGFIINRTAAKFKSELHKKLAPLNLTPEQWIVLMQLAETNGISQTEIARKIYKDNSTTTRLLDNLEKKDFIKRVPHHEDRRTILIYTTEKTLDLNSKTIPLVTEVLTKACKDIPQTNIVQLKDLLNLIFKNLE